MKVFIEFDKHESAHLQSLCEIIERESGHSLNDVATLEVNGNAETTCLSFDISCSTVSKINEIDGCTTDCGGCGNHTMFDPFDFVTNAKAVKPNGN